MNTKLHKFPNKVADRWYYSAFTTGFFIHNLKEHMLVSSFQPVLAANLKLAQLVPLDRTEELNPNLMDSKSNCRKLSSI